MPACGFIKSLFIGAARRRALTVSSELDGLVPRQRKWRPSGWRTPDPEGIATVLSAQLSRLQPDVNIVDPMEHGAKLRAIRALRLEITEVRSKFKYGGNVDTAHRLAVAKRLHERDGPGDRAAASHLQRRLDRGAS